MSIPQTIRKAKPGEARHLSELALRSKAFWGYTDEFIEACRAELAVTRQKLNAKDLHYVVAEQNGGIVGFYAVRKCDGQVYELEALFLDPGHIGKGKGKALMAHAKHKVRRLGGKTLMIQGDPNAERFYTSVGGKLVGERASGSIPGRNLPLFEIDLGNKDS